MPVQQLRGKTHLAVRTQYVSCQLQSIECFVTHKLFIYYVNRTKYTQNDANKTKKEKQTNKKPHTMHI